MIGMKGVGDGFLEGVVKRELWVGEGDPIVRELLGDVIYIYASRDHGVLLTVVQPRA